MLMRRIAARAAVLTPLVDVAAAGGWKDTQTLVNCYQHADRKTMLAVMSEPRKVSDRAVGT